MRFILIIMIPLILYLIPTSLYSAEYLEVKAFARSYGFGVYFYPKYRQLVFIRPNKQIRVKLNSELAIIDEKNIIKLDAKVIYYQQAFWLPNSIKKHLSNKFNPPKITIKQPQKQYKQQNNTYDLENQEFKNVPQPKYTKSDKVTTIILDPGHGGKDPGNCNNNLKEKDVNLKIALLVKAYINHYLPEIKVFLTREEDEFISLKDRTLIAIDKANEVPGEAIFISIHSNSSPSSSANGIETYFYTTNPIDIKKARAKYISEEVLKYGNIPENSLDLLIKMYDLEVSKESRLLSNFIHSSLLKQVKSLMTNRGQHGVIPYYVITHTPIPAVLCEVGFLSNQKDAKLISNSKFRSMLAKGISVGILKFVKMYNDTNGFRIQ